MIDTIKISRPLKYHEFVALAEKFRPEGYSGNTTYFGNLGFESVRVWTSPIKGTAVLDATCELTIEFTVAHLLRDNNIETCGPQELFTGLGLISERLALPLGQAKVTRLDSSVTLEMDHPPSNYVRAAINYRGMPFQVYRKRDLAGIAAVQAIDPDDTQTKVFPGGNNLLIYDKSAQIISLGGNPKSKYLLRLEYQIPSRVARALHLDSLTVEDFCLIETWKLIASVLANRVGGIIWAKPGPFDLEFGSTNRDVEEQLIAYALRHLTSERPEVDYLQTIVGLVADGKNRTQKSRARTKWGARFTLEGPEVDAHSEVNEKLKAKLDLAFSAAEKELSHLVTLGIASKIRKHRIPPTPRTA
jgi:hypothetical protein